MINQGTNKRCLRCLHANAKGCKPVPPLNKASMSTKLPDSDDDSDTDTRSGEDDDEEAEGEHDDQMDEDEDVEVDAKPRLVRSTTTTRRANLMDDDEDKVVAKPSLVKPTTTGRRGIRTAQAANRSPSVPDIESVYYVKVPRGTKDTLDGISDNLGELCRQIDIHNALTAKALKSGATHLPGILPFQYSFSAPPLRPLVDPSAPEQPGPSTQSESFATTKVPGAGNDDDPFAGDKSDNGPIAAGPEIDSEDEEAFEQAAAMA